MNFHQKLVVYYILDYFGILFIRDTCEMPSSAPVRSGGFSPGTPVFAQL